MTQSRITGNLTLSLSFRTSLTGTDLIADCKKVATPAFSKKKKKKKKKSVQNFVSAT